MFSESELAFLAFVFIVTLGCLMLERRRTDSPPVIRTNKKKRKRVKCNHCSLSGQNKNKRLPEENDDDETHNSRGTVVVHAGRIFKAIRRCRFDYVFFFCSNRTPDILLFHKIFFFFFTAIILINWSIKRCSQQQVNKNLELYS